jgi:hypothetical protein
VAARLEETSWEDAAEYAQSVPAKYLECRVRRRHGWRPRQVIPADFGFEIHERCTDCRSTSFYSINRRGVIVVPRRITHSDGYLNTRGRGRIEGEAFGALRLEWLHRKTDLVSDDTP